MALQNIRAMGLVNTFEQLSNMAHAHYIAEHSFVLFSPKTLKLYYSKLQKNIQYEYFT